MHLMAHSITQIVVVSISKMTGICTHHVKTGLGRDNIEKIDISTPVSDKPLGGISIIRSRRNRSEHHRFRFLLRGYTMDSATSHQDDP